MTAFLVPALFAASLASAPDAGKPHAAVDRSLTSAFRCGDRLIEVDFAGEEAILATGEARVRLVLARAASGARYEAPGAPATWFWSRGERAMVSLSGAALPECRATFPTAGEEFTARGNEPFWRAVLADRRMEIVRPGFEDLDLPVTAAELRADGALVTEAHDPQRALRAVLVRQAHRCTDSMSGMAYPETTELVLGDRVGTGCGGDPRDLLTGQDWIVEAIAGAAVSDDARLTLRFDDAGRVTGTGGCNRWFADYTLTGEGLSIGRAGSTAMACSDVEMARERRFLDALQVVYRHAFDGADRLVLHGPEGPVVRARAH